MTDADFGLFALTGPAWLQSSNALGKTKLKANLYILFALLSSASKSSENLRLMNAKANRIFLYISQVDQRFYPIRRRYVIKERLNYRDVSLQWMTTQVIES